MKKNQPNKKTLQKQQKKPKPKKPRSKYANHFVSKC